MVAAVLWFRGQAARAAVAPYQGVQTYSSSDNIADTTAGLLRFALANTPLVQQHFDLVGAGDPGRRVGWAAAMARSAEPSGFYHGHCFGLDDWRAPCRFSWCARDGAPVAFTRH